jgi:hypothetical protein
LVILVILPGFKPSGGYEHGALIALGFLAGLLAGLATAWCWAKP